MKDDTPTSGGVQSVRRALDLIEAVAARGGQLPIGEIAAATDLPLPTIHRLLRTLVDRGWMRQLPDRRYALGARLASAGVRAAQLVGASSTAVLDRLVNALEETANLAVLSGDRAEYVAQSPSPHAMRMFTEVGRRVSLHSTGVGKALLSRMTDEQVRAIVRRTGLPAATERTVASESALLDSLAEIRERGYAVDDEEQERGVRCIAVPVPSPSPAFMAVSVSGPAVRVDDAFLDRAAPLLREAAERLAAE